MKSLRAPEAPPPMAIRVYQRQTLSNQYPGRPCTLDREFGVSHQYLRISPYEISAKFLTGIMPKCSVKGTICCLSRSMESKATELRVVMLKYGYFFAAYRVY